MSSMGSSRPDTVVNRLGNITLREVEEIFAKLFPSLKEDSGSSPTPELDTGSS